MSSINYPVFRVLIYLFILPLVATQGPKGNKNLCFAIDEDKTLDKPRHTYRILASNFKQCADSCVNYPRSKCTFVIYHRVSGSCRLYDSDVEDAKSRLQTSNVHVFGAITKCKSKSRGGESDVATTGIEINNVKNNRDNRGSQWGKLDQQSPQPRERKNKNNNNNRGGRWGKPEQEVNSPRGTQESSPNNAYGQRIAQKWDDWTDWTPCSATCGDGGEQSRYRRCLSFSCDGEAEERRRCRARVPCADWADWTTWSSCSVTCEQGVRTRNRFCPNYVGCTGDRREQEPCMMSPCIQWTPWSGWSACSKLCGGGNKVRTRKCNGYGCPGQSTESTSCNEQSCCAAWSDWGSCSITCGLPKDGVEKRSRRCIVDAPGTPYGGYGSKAQDENRPCSAYALRPCAEWTNWGQFEQCSLTCGGGERVRRRQCSVPTPMLCPGRSEDVETCNAAPCPKWSDWGIWSTCGVTCGGGIMTRSRQCSQGNLCPGPANEEAPCNPYPCPAWSDWGPWDHCTNSCGGGFQKRSRVCDQYALCPGDPKEKRLCNEHSCPKPREWARFSQCDKSCDGGSKIRQRACKIDTNYCTPDRIETDPTCGCGETKMREVEQCNTQACAIFSAWEQWTPCTTTCGGGRSTRLRRCNKDQTFCLGHNVNDPSCQCVDEPVQETRGCSAHSCPKYREWTPWSTCTVTCGGGKQDRGRECVLDNEYCAQADADGASCKCVGQDKASRQCNAFLCPEYSPWDMWGMCTKSCGGGKRTRGRTCLTDAMLCNSDIMIDDKRCSCQEKPAETETCNDHDCPYWSPWYEWSPCSASCAGGERYRDRKCILDTAHCIGETALTDSSCSCPIGEPKTQTEVCNIHRCAAWTSWESWTPCSEACGRGSRTRGRVCTRDEEYCANYSGTSCECAGLTEEASECNTHYCALWETWQAWQTCSATCGGGQKLRRRPCDKDSTFCSQNPQDVSCKCDGSDSDTGKCNTYLCPYWAEWAPWGSCSVTCSRGQQIRRRPCNVDNNYCSTQELLSSASCQCLNIGKDLDTKSCDKGVCFQWSDWQPWSLCNVVCGGGSRTRARTCAQEGGCPGSPEETGVCNNVPCPSWGDWSAWSDCSVSCNGGQRARTRSCPLRGGCSPGDPYESEICGTAPCPMWTSWSDWGPCSKGCGHGERKRIRECEPIPDGCLGRRQDIEQCFEKPCALNTHWSEWSPCTLTCGGGLKTRSRASCPSTGCPIEEDTALCQSGACPQWTDWDQWSECSKTCGAGSRRRGRLCNADSGEEIINGCLGQPLQYDPQPCNDFACHVNRKRL